MIITASPHNASLPYLLAALLAALGSVASGQEIYDSGRLVDRATAARAAGDYATAIQTLEIVVARDPAQLPARLLLAETLAWAKRFAEAEREYRRALDQVSSSHDGKLGLARVLLWQGRYSAARPLFLSLTTANPHDL
ncbi:MAG: tetratricopeptide repeat protein, partial [Thermoanaerobaculia bacterium]